ncbi:MAG: N-acetylmuramoyl-L-alanine amidase [Roseomonas sp.]|nr:N-acetylmuramoyl-L-alanine amidase [Roseomonas sp.]MCA3306975.1 N-acetylmuramoyl-L-alanine amidase [Roseomonas sp.]
MASQERREKHDGMGIGRRHFLGLGGVVLGGAKPALAASVNAASLKAEGRVARLSLTLEGPLSWEWRALAEPPRLVLSLPGVTWQGPARLGSAGPVASAVFSAVFDDEAKELRLNLARPALPRRLPGPAGRLLVEIAPASSEAFAAAARRDMPLAQGSAPALPLVVIDPGHGGYDPGAIGRRGTEEKRLTLAAAQALRRKLQEGGKCRVAMTRERDEFISLADRVAFARTREAALLISLHADSAPGAKGASVYTLAETASDPLSEALAQRENNADLAGGLSLPSVSPEVQAILLSLMRQETLGDSARFARVAVRELTRAVPILPKPRREAGFIVLKAPEVPSVLVEMGFLSDPEDEAALRKPEHRALIATSLARAVEAWVGSTQRPRPG